MITQKMAWKYGFIIPLVILVILIFASPFRKLFSLPIAPEQAVQNFYNNIGPEETFLDPLILGGAKAVPLVLEEVKKRDMPRRPYAILFLGNGSYQEALPVLEFILHDTTENEYMRGAALQSIYMIEEHRGLQFSDIYKDDPSHLGRISKDLVTNKNYLMERRSYVEALSWYLFEEK